MKKSRAASRVVSKSEYIANIGLKAACSSVGAGLLLVGLVCLLVAGLILCLVILHSPHEPIMVFMGGVIVPVLLYGAIYVYRLGSRAIKETSQMDVGVPLTRSSAADLPATSVLVRASEKPSEEQASILLRAAAETNATPTDQLLRPSTEKIMEAHMPEENTLKVGGDANG